MSDGLRLKSCLAFALATSLSLAPLLAERAAFAADSPASTADAQKSAAKAKYEQGVELYRNQRYADAVALFLQADALAPSPALSFNIARAYEKLADDAATLRWYRNYLRLSPEAPNANEVRQSIQLLSSSLAKKGIQQLTVLSTPMGATVAIDNQPLGVTPLTVELKPGAHHALVTLRGFTDVQRDFTLNAPTPMDLPFELSPPPASAPPLAEPTHAQADSANARGRRFGVAPYIVLGAGAVALGAAALFEARRHSAQTAAQNDKTQLAAQYDENAMNSRQTTARGLLGVGGALAVTGATLLILNTRVTPESSAGVAVLPGGAGLSFTRSF